MSYPNVNWQCESGYCDSTLAQLQQQKNIELQSEWDKGMIKVQTEEAKKGAAIQAKQVLESIKTSEALQRSKDRADVSSKKELQKTEVTFSAEDDVILQKECFGEDIKGRLPIKIRRAILFSHENDMERKVLYIYAEKSNGDEAVLYWDVEKNEDRWIRKAFESNGISFGFGARKEAEVRRQLLLAVFNRAETMVLAEQHGWYQLDGKLQYAFPEELTWKEVDKKC